MHGQAGIDDAVDRDGQVWLGTISPVLCRRKASFGRKARERVSENGVKAAKMYHLC